MQTGHAHSVMVSIPTVIECLYLHSCAYLTAGETLSCSHPALPQPVGLLCHSVLPCYVSTGC